MADALTNTNPRRTMLGLALGACVVLGAMGLITWQALRIEDRERLAQAQAQFHESLRLALWRIDSAMTPIIAREASRPYFEYQSFYPAEPTVDALHVGSKDTDAGPADRESLAAADSTEDASSATGEVFVPSPLLSNNDAMVKLHFQREPDGTLNSPQAPQGKFRELAEAGWVTPYAVTQNQERLVQLEQQIGREAGADGRGTPRDGQGAALEKQAQGAEPPAAQDEETARAPAQTTRESENEYIVRRDLVNKTSEQYSQQAVEQANRQQRAMNVKEGRARGARGEEDAKNAPADRAEPAPAAAPARTAEPDAGHGELKKDKAAPGTEDDAGAVGGTKEEVGATPGASGVATVEPISDARGTLDAGSMSMDEMSGWPAGEIIVQGQFTPRWLDQGAASPELVFVRQVRVGGRTLEQGFWLDWPRLESTLLEPVRPLFPECAIRPVVELDVGGGGPARPTSRLLATIPAELAVPAPVLAMSAPWTPLRSALVVGWLLVVVSLVAFFAVARASIELAERRGRFVSAVTHELRTPLTTFCLYSQMLSEGMVGDEETKRSYAKTLHSESLRLARIVESVLDFARLGRGVRPVLDATTLADLRARVEPALAAASERCGMRLEASAESDGAVTIHTDASLVERALANLVDNACKYAGGAADPRIALVWSVDKDRLRVRVRDFGPGIPQDEARRVFAAFVRGRSHAHGGTPGLGLGLALSRELAARLGGELRLTDASPGAEFVLDVPAA